jgi:hypothetical protein
MATSNRQYAEKTTVTIGRTKDAIISELQRLGASRRAFYDDDEGGRAMIVFERSDRRYRFELPLPSSTDPKYRYTPARRYVRSETEQRAAWTQDCQARWRGLAEYIKAMRIAHELGIVRAEEALLPYLLLPNDQTVGDWLDPQVAEVYATNQMPSLLPGASVKIPPFIQIAPAESEE